MSAIGRSGHLTKLVNKNNGDSIKWIKLNSMKPPDHGRALAA